MDLTTTIVLLSISVAILLIGAVIYIIIRLREKSPKESGKKGEKAVNKVLKKFARFRDAKILSDVYLPLYDETTQIDHILVAPFGVLVIETKHWGGNIYANPAEEKWLQVIGDDRNYHYNPLMQNKTHTDNLRHVFKSEKVFRVNVEGAVVFSNRRSTVYSPRNIPVYTMKQFKKLLKKSQYEADNKVDVAKVCAAIEKNRVTDKNAIVQHVKNVKKKEN